MTRRDFVKSATAAGTTAFLGKALASGERVDAQPVAPTKPVAIASANGLQATAKAMSMILQGADALDGVIAGVKTKMELSNWMPR